MEEKIPFSAPSSSSRHQRTGTTTAGPPSHHYGTMADAESSDDLDYHQSTQSTVSFTSRNYQSEEEEKDHYHTGNQKHRWTTIILLVALISISFIVYFGQQTSFIHGNYDLSAMYKRLSPNGAIMSSQSSILDPTKHGLMKSSNHPLFQDSEGTDVEEEDVDGVNPRKPITKVECLQRIDNIDPADANTDAFKNAFIGTVSNALSTSHNNVVIDYIVQADMDLLDESEWPDAVDVTYEVTMTGTDYMTVRNILISAPTTESLNTALHRAGYPKAQAGAPLMTVDLSPTYAPTPSPTNVGDASPTTEPTTEPSEIPTESPTEVPTNDDSTDDGTTDDDASNDDDDAADDDASNDDDDDDDDDASNDDDANNGETQQPTDTPTAKPSAIPTSIQFIPWTPLSNRTLPNPF